MSLHYWGIKLAIFELLNDTEYPFQLTTITNYFSNLLVLIYSYFVESIKIITNYIYLCIRIKYILFDEHTYNEGWSKFNMIRFNIHAAVYTKIITFC